MEFYRSNVKYNFLRKLLIQSHKSSHLNRVSILSNEYAKIIKEKMPTLDTIRCLDVGCGDMKIAKNIFFSQRMSFFCMELGKRHLKLISLVLCLLAISL